MHYIFIKFPLFSVCFGSFCFVSVQHETPKRPVLILKRNNRNRHHASDSFKTIFGSSFELKLDSQDTLNSEHIYASPDKSHRVYCGNAQLCDIKDKLTYEQVTIIKGSDERQ
jgi:hypothetical protein